MSWSVFVLCSQCPAEECSPTATTGDNPLQEVSQGISNLPVIQTALQYVYSTVRSKSHLLILHFCIDKTMSSYHGRGDNCWVLTDGWRKEPVWCDVGSTSIEVFLLNRAPGKELTTFPLHCHVTWWSEHPLRWRPRSHITSLFPAACVHTGKSVHSHEGWRFCNGIWS